MIFKQYYLGCLSHASYLIGDEQSRAAAVVDPQRDIEGYLADAASLGLEIRHVLLTHFHADFVAGHLELRRQTGAEIYLGSRAEAEYRFTPLGDGDTVELGQVRLTILETPGHTPEGISILVFDLAKEPRNPYAVLTGDTLFIGDVGRPDLLASIGVTADELADMLYESLHEKLLKLPDETLVYPAHGAGSLCGKNLSTDTVSTIGTQRKFNYALQPMSREEFRRLVTADQPDAPDYFVHDAIMNRKERTVLDESLLESLKGLSLDEVLRLQSEGAEVLDVREAIDFEAGHLVGSLNVGLKGKYATWAGTMLERTRPIVLVAEPGDEQEAAMRLGRIGLDNVVGFLEGGPQALVGRAELVGRTERMTAANLADVLSSAEPPQVLDVRTAAEWEAGHIPSSRNIPLNQLRKRLAEVPRQRQIVVHCAGGYRSAIAASLLEQRGFGDVVDLVGGYAAWEKLGAAVSG